MNTKFTETRQFYYTRSGTDLHLVGVEHPDFPGGYRRLFGNYTSPEFPEHGGDPARGEISQPIPVPQGHRAKGSAGDIYCDCGKTYRTERNLIRHFEKMTAQQPAEATHLRIVK